MNSFSSSQTKNKVSLSHSFHNWLARPRTIHWAHYLGYVNKPIRQADASQLFMNPFSGSLTNNKVSLSHFSDNYSWIHSLAPYLTPITTIHESILWLLNQQQGFSFSLLSQLFMNPFSGSLTNNKVSLSHSYHNCSWIHSLAPYLTPITTIHESILQHPNQQ